jgi:hypothetical protein
MPGWSLNAAEIREAAALTGLPVQAQETPLSLA